MSLEVSFSGRDPEAAGGVRVEPVRCVRGKSESLSAVPTRQVVEGERLQSQVVESHIPIFPIGEWS